MKHLQARAPASADAAPASAAATAAAEEAERKTPKAKAVPTSAASFLSSLTFLFGNKSLFWLRFVGLSFKVMILVTIVFCFF